MARKTKRKDGRYQQSVFLGHDENGKEIRKSIYAKTLKELDDKVAKFKSDLITNTYIHDRTWTFGAYARHWLALKSSTISESRLGVLSAAINNHIKDIDDILLSDLTKSDIQKCLNRLNDKYATQKELRGMINSILEDAIDDGLMYRNVSRKATIGKKKARKTRALTPAERNVIPGCDFTLEERCFIYLIWYAGLRPEEVRALTIHSIDLNNEVIHVENCLAFGKNQGHLKEPKTYAGIRDIDILPPLLPVLSDYLMALDKLYLFTQKNGQLHTKTTYRRFWSKIYDKINAALGGRKEIKKRVNGKTEIVQTKIAATDIYPYVFRHEYATILYYSGIDIKEAARLMGHADTSMILNIYAELDKKKSSSKSKLSEYLAQDY